MPPKPLYNLKWEFILRQGAQQSSLPVLPVETSASRPRLPSWLRVNLPIGESRARFNRTTSAVSENQLHTVCEEARCPNIHDCWGQGTATFMIAGKECTRGCRFCAVETLKAPAPPDLEEPAHLAEAVERMGLSYVVITVVNRDDLPDGGAGHYRACVDAVHKRLPEVGIELLSSDLNGNLQALEGLVDGIPLQVFAHNVECVPRLDVAVRDPRASFDLSLRILHEARRLRPDLLTKTSLMVGVGETDAEISQALRRLREEAEVDMITLGQYLAPANKYLPVDRFVPPSQFAEWDQLARELGFKAVASGPLVRSSYRAGLLVEEARTGQRIAPSPTSETYNSSGHGASEM
ncbi:MAG: lipoyl synthase [Pirellulales bacterium]|nr:lipoyl synthase [Pirellulales bacterium]